MRKNVYKKLAAHLDNLPGGYPSTTSGVELRILERLFTPEEAEMAPHLALIPEEARVLAHRAKRSEEGVKDLLDDMFRKGLILKLTRKGRPPKYMALQYAIGIWEYHVEDLDRELAEDMAEYLPVLLNPETWGKSPQLRTVPIGKSISHQLEIMPYEIVEEVVKQQDKIIVAPCICRREKKLVGEGCDRPEDSCLVLGRASDLYRERGIGRDISREEALEILRKADEAGLVLQPSNSKDIINICCCCGCCCGVLRSIKRHPRPATIVSTPFICAADEEKCSGCGVCLERCQMEALCLEGDRVVLDTDRCIGCGLCVSTCPTDALTLVRKPQSAQKEVPNTFRDAMVALAKARGKLKPVSAAKMVMKSKLDRLRTSK
ncbi:MAG: 4Fe-4S binding protein [Candidatus Aminicenantes bacterium]|nr:4Fe-4S binding protein [Candidatus Aminicenantes bacterium]